MGFLSDHIGNVGVLMLKRLATSDPTEPLPIYGPPGVEEVVAGLETACELDRIYRIAHYGEEAVQPSGSGKGKLLKLGQRWITLRISKLYRSFFDYSSSAEYQRVSMETWMSSRLYPPTLN
jgi:hypothetical protein